MIPAIPAILVLAIAAAFGIGMWVQRREVKFLDAQLEILYALASAAMWQGIYIPHSPEWEERNQEIDGLVKKLATTVGIPEDDENL